ncbi:MAG: ferrous iron transporter B [Ignavibacteria bacterium]|nr:MAG: ferrous iron transporter B [Ignavibacteria bacterium]
MVDGFFGAAAEFVTNTYGHNVLSDLVSEGLISGVGSVMVFVPQIIILFLILGLMEDTGYLARGAMIADKPLNKIGLNGRSFVPMLSGFACAVPAIMAARTIPSRKERLLTIFILPLMSCSARLPVYVLLLAFLTPHDKLWIAGISLAGIYLFSISSSTIIAAIINKFNKNLIKDTENSSFILELPAYRMPKLKVVLRNTYLSTTAYLRKAGPIILGLSIVIWFLSSFPEYQPSVDENGNQIKVEDVSSYRLENSYAAEMGKLIQPVMEPLGMDWRVGVSLISAFAAREIFVSSLALIFKVTAENDEALQESILTAMRKAKINGNEPLFTPSKVIGLIIFFVFALQCLSTVAVSRQETGSWRIPILQLAIYTPFAYLAAFITINLLQLFGVA